MDNHVCKMMERNKSHFPFVFPPSIIVTIENVMIIANNHHVKLQRNLIARNHFFLWSLSFYLSMCLNLLSHNPEMYFFQCLQLGHQHWNLSLNLSRKCPKTKFYLWPTNKWEGKKVKGRCFILLIGLPVNLKTRVIFYTR